MATTKKRATTKKAPAKNTAAKRTPAKKAPVKKVAAKKTTVRKTTARKSPVKRASARASEMQSFKIARDTTPFTTFKITRQTVYWVVLVAFIVLAQLWILKLQVEVVTLLNIQQAQIENF